MPDHTGLVDHESRPFGDTAHTVYPDLVKRSVRPGNFLVKIREEGKIKLIGLLEFGQGVQAVDRNSHYFASQLVVPLEIIANRTHFLAAGTGKREGKEQEKHITPTKITQAHLRFIRCKKFEFRSFIALAQRHQCLVSYHSLTESAKDTKPGLAVLFCYHNLMRRAYLFMHVAVVLYGLTAILGKVISLSAIPLVWWRVLLTSISLVFFVRVGKILREVPRERLMAYVGIGCLVALHWITFFLAIKLSNASICLVALATQSLFTALIEPAVLKRRVRITELIMGALMIPAMLLIVREVEVSMQAGIWIGLLSAILVAAFTCFNKKLISDADPMRMTFVELGSAWLFISLLLPFLHRPELNGPIMPRGIDWLYLVILVLACTTLAWLLVLYALKYLSAFSSNLIANLEPVYGILLAWIILGEHRDLTPGFYLGAAVMTGIVLINPVVTRHFHGKQSV